MNTQIKAIAAAVSGAVAGPTAGAIFLPDGSPWYAYVAMALITGGLPYLGTYFAPRNAP